MNDYKVVKFKNDRINIDVRLDRFNNTVWQTKREIAVILDVSESVIEQTLKRINESEKDASKTNNLSAKEISKYIIDSTGKTCKTKLYNMDMIEAISLQLNSIQGYSFVLMNIEKLLELLQNGGTLEMEFKLLEKRKRLMPIFFDELVKQILLRDKIIEQLEKKLDHAYNKLEEIISAIEKNKNRFF